MVFFNYKYIRTRFNQLDSVRLQINCNAIGLFQNVYNYKLENVKEINVKSYVNNSCLMVASFEN